MPALVTVLTDQRPKAMSHPAVIAGYVEDLLTTLTNVPRPAPP